MYYATIVAITITILLVLNIYMMVRHRNHRECMEQVILTCDETCRARLLPKLNAIFAENASITPADFKSKALPLGEPILDQLKNSTITALRIEYKNTQGGLVENNLKAYIS
jgi:hypothetical protein